MTALAGVGARTDPGRVRDHNEDAFLCEPPLFAIADGMGGHNAGEVASAIAIEALRAARRAFDRDGRAALLRALGEANAQIVTAGRSADRAGMGTTCVSAWIEPGVATIAHVGDSRAYLIRAGALQRLTADHSVVGALVREGVLDATAASRDARRNIITKALGAGRSVEPDVASLELLPGDRLLLCSDGLTETVAEQRILEIAGAAASADEVAERLIAAAYDGGAPDNVTVVVVDPDLLEDPEPSRPARRGWLERLGLRRSVRPER